MLVMSKQLNLMLTVNAYTEAGFYVNYSFVQLKATQHHQQVSRQIEKFIARISFRSNSTLVLRMLYTVHTSLVWYYRMELMKRYRKFK